MDFGVWIELQVRVNNWKRPFRHLVQLEREKIWPSTFEEYEEMNCMRWRFNKEQFRAYRAKYNRDGTLPPNAEEVVFVPKLVSGPRPGTIIKVCEVEEQATRPWIHPEVFVHCAMFAGTNKESDALSYANVIVHAGVAIEVEESR